MKRWKLWLPLLLALAALAVGGLAYSSVGANAQLAGQDRLCCGGGTDPGCFVPDIDFCRTISTDFGVDAHATSTGQAAYGDMVGADRHEQITCLAVDGNNAVIGGIITSAPANPSTIGFLFAQFYVDDGATAFGGDLVSPFYVNPADLSLWPPGFPYVCPSPVYGAPDFGLVRSFLPISRGDIVIQDAPQQQPTGKEMV